MSLVGDQATLTLDGEDARNLRDLLEAARAEANATHPFDQGLAAERVREAAHALTRNGGADRLLNAL